MNNWWLLLLCLPMALILLRNTLRRAMRDEVAEAIAGMISNSKVELLDISKTSICSAKFRNGADQICLSWYPWGTLRNISINGLDAPVTGPGRPIILRAALNFAEAEFRRRAADIVNRHGAGK